MRLECPACAASYDVPDALLAPGRAVRCVRCAESWVPLPHRLAAPPPRLALPPLRPFGPAGPDGEADPEGPSMARSGMAGSGLAGSGLAGSGLAGSGLTGSGLTGALLAWVLSLVAVAAGGVALWSWRAEIAAAWPPAARLLALLPAG